MDYSVCFVRGLHSLTAWLKLYRVCVNLMFWSQEELAKNLCLFANTNLIVHWQKLRLALTPTTNGHLTSWLFRVVSKRPVGN